MSAVLFGSIGTLVETSEMSRKAFNQAFQDNGLDWNWDRDAYIAMLPESGGLNRVAKHAQSLGQDVDADAIYRSKSEIYHAALGEAALAPRPGVLDTIAAARESGTKLGLVTTTSPDTVAAILGALAPDVRREDFAVVVDVSKVGTTKPDPAAYTFAMDALGEQPEGCVAIEDNVTGLTAAVGAGVPCVAFPGANTADHDYSQARSVVAELDPTSLLAR